VIYRISARLAAAVDLQARAGCPVAAHFAAPASRRQISAISAAVFML
jgi:hypothetical protein